MMLLASVVILHPVRNSLDHVIGHQTDRSGYQVPHTCTQGIDLAGQGMHQPIPAAVAPSLTVPQSMQCTVRILPDGVFPVHHGDVQQELR